MPWITVKKYPRWIYFYVGGHDRAAETTHPRWLLSNCKPRNHVTTR